MCDTGPNIVGIQLPDKMLDQIDAFAVRNGYATLSAVVSDIFQRADTNRHVQYRTP
ncbi:MAG: hypothetical protein J07HX5_02159 [halophilic archaeon J07HX5]|nr:MAG: hypothetical protein J07HX5_02159 [halophilic archaeon J07HX5]